MASGGPHTSPASWHALAVQEAAQRCAADLPRGLSSAAARERLGAHGPNALPEAPPTALWRTFVRQFRSPLIYILFLAALLAIFLAGKGDAAVILGVVLINAVVGTLQEHRAERSMAELKKFSALQVHVLRDGAQQTISAREVTVGDVLLLAAGDAVAADARLFEQAQLHVAEAALTGESVPVAKSVEPLPPATALADRRNMVYAGTHVTAGRGQAMVIAVGANTEVGAIAQLTAGAQEPITPLEARLTRFGHALLAAAFAVFVLIIVLGIWRSVPLPELVMIAISQMVSMVPEGLPVAMTIALAVGVQRMAQRGAIIRRLSAVETLGSTTVICTDKTGTLTRNELTAVAVWLPGGREIAVSGVGYAPAGELIEGGRPATIGGELRELLIAAVLCNDAEVRSGHAQDDAWRVLGDPTEGALLVLARKAGLDPGDVRRAAPRQGELPFDSEARLMATRHEMEHGRRVILLKGAPEAVLRLTADSALAHAARAAADGMAQRALRVLAFAQTDGRTHALTDFEALAGRVRLLGLVGQVDAPREEVKPAVAECRRAGIRPVVVTGDHKLTALAIARELGIASASDLALDGVELERMTEPDLRALIDRVAVFARVQPAQKMRIVEALQARGDVVAMTGDGVNDAPALARADVGVAMGLTGTEVAKSAAKIVITDDNFATIVTAVEQGRIVYGSIKKLILYLFATSIDEVAILLLALFSGYPMPLAAVQILWINIVTEGTLTLNMVLDPAEGDEMSRCPVPRHDALLDADMLRRASLMALVTVAGTFCWFVWRFHQGIDLAQVRTETFTLLAMCQWFNALNCQSSHRSALRARLFANPWLLGGLGVSFVLQLAVVFLPPMNSLFHTVPLAAGVFGALALLASAVLWLEEARKYLVRLRRSRDDGAPRDRTGRLHGA